MSGDEIGEALARDGRLRDVHLGIELEHNRLFQVVLEHLSADKDSAVVAFARADPTDLGAICKLQVRVLALVRLIEILNNIRSTSKAAEADLLAEDRARGEQDDYERHDGT